MKILCHLVHPAHFHLFIPIIKQLEKNGNEVLITIRNKDVLENLLKENSRSFIKISDFENRKSRISLIIGILKKAFSLLRICYKYKPNILISSATEIAITGKLIGIPSILFFEDDLEYVKKWAQIAGPLASTLICPSSCSADKWEHKTIKYHGYHELTYLRPNYFQSSESEIISSKPKYLLRLAKLTAYHDDENSGIDNKLADILINKLKEKGKVYISAERELADEFKEFKLSIKPSELLSFMKGIDIYIGDSQTMAAEAAVLGIPSIRFNDFVGKLGYLEELEHKYGLTYGIKTSEPDKLLKKIDELLKIPDIKEEWQKRRAKMLADKIDVTAFMVWFIENYPESVKVMREKPEYQYNFR